MIDDLVTRMNFSKCITLSTHSSCNDEYTLNNLTNSDTFFKMPEDQHHNLDLGLDDAESYESEESVAEGGDRMYNTFSQS